MLLLLIAFFLPGWKIRTVFFSCRVCSPDAGKWSLVGCCGAGAGAGAGAGDDVR